MGLDDIWYTSKQIYSINYRPLKPGSNLVVETIRFNPSVCTCGKQCSEPHYRMESRVINIADKVDIKESNMLAYEHYTSKVNSDDKSVNEMRAKVDIDRVISPSKGSVINSSNGDHSTANEIEAKSAINVSLTSVDVSGDCDRETPIERGKSIKNDVEDRNVKISNMKYVDNVIGIGDNVKCDVEVMEFRNDVKSETECEFINVNNTGSIDDIIGNNKSVKNGSEVGHCNVSNKEFSDGVTGNNCSVKNGSEGGHCNVSNKEFSDGVTGNNSSVKNGFECGHFNVSYVEDDFTEDDNSVKKGAEVVEFNNRNVDYQDCATGDISAINQDSGKYEDVSVSIKDEAVDITCRSSMNQNDDHDIDEVDDVTVSDQISRGTSNADLRYIDVEIEESDPNDTTEFVEEISAAFGIMSVYCNSDLHSSEYICKDGYVLDPPYKRLDSGNDWTVAIIGQCQ